MAYNSRGHSTTLPRSILEVSETEGLVGTIAAGWTGSVIGIDNKLTESLPTHEQTAGPLPLSLAA